MLTIKYIQENLANKLMYLVLKIESKFNISKIIKIYIINLKDLEYLLI